MAARNFRTAADATARHPERAAALGVDGAEAAAWRTAADAMVIPFDEELGVTAQSEGFTRYRHWDFENTKDDEYPLLLHSRTTSSIRVKYKAGGSRLRALRLWRLLRYRAKATGLRVLRANHRAGFVTVGRDPGDRRGGGRARPAGVRLFPGIGARRSYRTSTTTRTMDFISRRSPGPLQVAVAGFGGARHYGGSRLRSSPTGAAVTRIAFRVLYRGRRMYVEIGPESTSYRLLSGEPL